jgi:hypothetical protein
VLTARRFQQVAVACTVLLLTGCTATPARGPHIRLARGTPFEPDIPVPAKFGIVDRASEDRSTGTSRLYLRHLYEGSADKHALRAFYREQMPLARWTKVSDGNVKGNIVMRYEKNAESCTIMLTSKQGVFGDKAQIQVIVAREERGQRPPATRKAQ